MSFQFTTELVEIRLAVMGKASGGEDMPPPHVPSKAKAVKTMGPPPAPPAKRNNRKHPESPPPKKARNSSKAPAATKLQLSSRHVCQL